MRESTKPLQDFEFLNFYSTHSQLSSSLSQLFKRWSSSEKLKGTTSGHRTYTLRSSWTPSCNSFVWRSAGGRCTNNEATEELDMVRTAMWQGGSPKRAAGRLQMLMWDAQLPSGGTKEASRTAAEDKDRENAITAAGKGSSCLAGAALGEAGRFGRAFDLAPELRALVLRDLLPAPCQEPCRTIAINRCEWLLCHMLLLCLTWVCKRIQMTFVYQSKNVQSVLQTKLLPEVNCYKHNKGFCSLRNIKEVWSKSRI